MVVVLTPWAGVAVVGRGPSSYWVYQLMAARRQSVTTQQNIVNDVRPVQKKWIVFQTCFNVSKWEKKCDEFSTADKAN